MSQDVISELASTGTLRAGINMANGLLVTGSSPAGDPEGVAPDMAREIADRLGVDVSYVPFPSPGELADAAGTDVWDIGLIAAEPARAETIAFSAAYLEIEEASADLGASFLTTFYKIVLPIMFPAFIAGFIYTFMTAIVSLSAVVFLVSPGTCFAVPSTFLLFGRSTTVDDGADSTAESRSAVLGFIVSPP